MNEIEHTTPYSPKQVLEHIKDNQSPMSISLGKELLDLLNKVVSGFNRAIEHGEFETIYTDDGLYCKGIKLAIPLSMDKAIKKKLYASAQTVFSANGWRDSMFSFSESDEIFTITVWFLMPIRYGG